MKSETREEWLERQLRAYSRYVNAAIRMSESEVPEWQIYDWARVAAILGRELLGEGE